MTRRPDDHLARKLEQVEGFLMLNLPLRALDILESRRDWATLAFEASFLTGEARRQVGRYRDALEPLEKAARMKPGHVGVAIALGWCYKRTARLAQAIDALERALAASPDEPLLHYNLACYWCLAGHPDRAVDRLASSLGLEPDLRDRVAAEPDFDAIRTHPDYERLMFGRTPSA
jgi:tetratricopeptide (TPR) repeat protein